MIRGKVSYLFNIQFWQPIKTLDEAESSTRLNVFILKNLSQAIYLRSMWNRLIIISLGLLFLHCAEDSKIFKVQNFPTPATLPVETPNWYLSPQNNLYLSWTEHLNDSIASLHYAIMQDSSWGEAHVAAQGSQWFVNWADFPSITTFPSSDLSVLGHFLQKSDTGRNYNYGVRLALSRDGGETFHMIDTLHDTAPSEHGFVSLLPFSFDKVMAVWLDGRAMSTSDHHTTGQEHGNESHGSMQLRSAFVHFDHKILEPHQIDDRVCECCQTDLAMTPHGPIVVYRNRSDAEERDIYFSRYNLGQWSEPKPVFEDHWKIYGCPVNGPAIASHNNKVAVVWYTEAGGTPTVKWSTSEDGGDHFKAPTIIATNNTIGRVDIIWLDDNHLAITYIDKKEKDDEFAQLQLEIHNTSDQSIKHIAIGTISSKRRSGFPVIEKYRESLYLAYTQVEEDSTSIQVKKISW